MRAVRAVQSGRSQDSLFLYGTNNIFYRKLANNAALNSDQSAAHLLGNQLNYSNQNYSWNGTNPAPSFYGYANSGPASPNYANVGYSGLAAGFEVTVDYTSFTIPIYIVDASVPNQTVTFVNFANSTAYFSDTYTVRSAGSNNNMQSYFNAVPVPDVTKIPQGQIQSSGSDGHVVIWRPSTNELWEMWRFTGSPGSYVFGYGAYVANVGTFNGIYTNGWGGRACGLASAGGVITIQDIVDVLHGGSINHALGISIPVTAPSNTAPATRHDSMTSTAAHPYVNDDGVTPNQAAANSGFVDAVAEGTWCRFPASFNPATSMSTAGPIAQAIATAIRDYGLFINDSSGNSCAFNLEDARVLGSPYSWAKVNPFSGSTGTAAGFYDSYINNNVPSTWSDSSLPKVTEILHGPTSIFAQIPWNQLQQIQPFSS